MNTEIITNVKPQISISKICYGLALILHLYAYCQTVSEISLRVHYYRTVIQIFTSSSQCNYILFTKYYGNQNNPNLSAKIRTASGIVKSIA
jgi:hypothetical protein